MKKTLQNILFLFAFFISCFQTLGAATSTPPFQMTASQIKYYESIKDPVKLTGVDCFDYYKFGSASIDLDYMKQASAGTDVYFAGKILNQNPYPITDVTIYAKIYRVKDKIDDDGPDLIDIVKVVEGMSVDKNSTQNIRFSWKAPLYAKSGKYKVITYITTSKEFNISGLTFTDDIAGNEFPFELVSENKKVVQFDKNKFTLQGNKYFFAAFARPVAANKSAELGGTIKNETDSDEKVPVVWKIYSWDGQKESNLIETRTDSILVKKNSSANINLVVQDNKYPVYFVIGELTWRDTKSIVNMRFTKDGNNIPKINFPSLLDYPLKKGVATTYFSCLHNTGDSNLLNDVKLDMTLKDGSGNIIDQYAYSGDLTLQMMGVKKDFVPEKDYDNLVLEAKIYQDDKLVETTNIKYDCNKINPEYCSPSSNISSLSTLPKFISIFTNPKVGFAFIAALLILAVGILVKVFYKKI